MKYFDYAIQEAKKYGIYQTVEEKSVGASIWLPPLSKEKSQQQVGEKNRFILNSNTFLGAESLTRYQQIVASMSK